MMRFLNDVLVVFIFLVFLTNGFGQVPKEKKRIVVLDPGHGGVNSGAIGVNGVKEKDIVLSIAKKIDSLNSTLFNNALEIYLTRYKDTLISLGDRTKLAQILKADLFISLHCNQATTKSTRGAEVYVSNKESRFLKEAIGLGFEVEKVLISEIGLKSRGVKFANFQVLRETMGFSPSILIELGFLSQTEEAIYLSKEDTQNAIALVTLQSIIKNLGL